MENKEIEKSKRYKTVLSYFSPDICDGIEKCVKERGVADINEIRLRSHGVCAILADGKNIPLGIRLDRVRLAEVFKKICSGAIFAHRDDICRGFVSLEGGIRVGVCGRARYDGGALVGVGDISSLVFRIPTGECSYAERLYLEWKRYGGGMLICSSAGEGKTTAIRALSRLIGSGADAKRVVVVDERCEFAEGDYINSHVDILRGYRRAVGVDIALRTMSSEVMVVDEISSREDALAMASAMGAGALVIATVHARDLEGAMRRDYVRDLVVSGMFSSVCTLRKVGAKFTFSVAQIKPNSLIN